MEFSLRPEKQEEHYVAFEETVRKRIHRLTSRASVGDFCEDGT